MASPRYSLLFLTEEVRLVLGGTEPWDHQGMMLLTAESSPAPLPFLSPPSIFSSFLIVSFCLRQDLVM